MKAALEAPVSNPPTLLTRVVLMDPVASPPLPGSVDEPSGQGFAENALPLALTVQETSQVLRLDTRTVDGSRSS